VLRKLFILMLVDACDGHRKTTTKAETEPNGLAHESDPPGFSGGGVFIKLIVGGGVGSDDGEEFLARSAAEQGAVAAAHDGPFEALVDEHVGRQARIKHLKVTVDAVQAGGFPHIDPQTAAHLGRPTVGAAAVTIERYPGPGRITALGQRSFRHVNHWRPHDLLKTQDMRHAGISKRIQPFKEPAHATFLAIVEPPLIVALAVEARVALGVGTCRTRH
jgi:hypothetical protein